MLTRCLATAAALALTCGAAWAETTLTILHTNDFHARFEPINSSDSTCGDKDAAEGKCFGGTARLVTAVSDARGRSRNVILVDGGDQFQGSLFYTSYKGAVSAEFMNALGYDAMTIGNHEFDDGPEVLKGFLDTVKFPVLMSNADLSREPLLRDVVKKSTVIERNGERIGLIGLTPEDTPELASPGPNITFGDPVAAVQGEVDRLTAEGITKIVVLSHSGYDVDKRVAGETTGVDVIVGGHTNTYLSNTSDAAQGPYPTMVGDTAIVSAYAYGKFLGEMNVTFDDAGKVVSANGEPVILDAAVAQHQPTVERLQVLAQPLQEIRDKVVAQSDTAIDGARETCRARECEMGNLVAEAQLDRVRDQGIAISLVNSGGLRASIDAGPVTMGEVLSVLPFQNTLATFRTSGATVVAALENGASQMDKQAGRFLQVAGLTYTVDPAAPVGARISGVMVNTVGGWAGIDPAATYGVVINNYVRNGGDGFAMFTTDASDVYDFGPDLADVVADYLLKGGPYRAATDGRITVKN